MMLLIFTSLAVGTYSSVILVENSGKIAAIYDDLHAAVKTRDERFKALEARLRMRTEDRYHASDAAADLAKRDEQIDLLWKHIKRLERRR